MVKIEPEMTAPLANKTQRQPRPHSRLLTKEL